MFDGDLLFDQLVDQSVEFRHEFNDGVDQEHTLAIKLCDKTHDHTRVDHQGNIIEDSVINISNIALDDIPLGYLATQTAVYQHNNNGNSEYVNDKFYGAMGCNGTVELKFNSPVYLWLLEKNKY